MTPAWSGVGIGWKLLRPFTGPRRADFCFTRSCCVRPQPLPCFSSPNSPQLLNKLFKRWQQRRLIYLFFSNLIFPPPIVSHFDHTLRPSNDWCFITSSRRFIQVALTCCLTMLGGLAIAYLHSGVAIKCTQLFRPCLWKRTTLCSFGHNIQFALTTRAFIVVIFICSSSPFLAYRSQ